MPTNRDSRLAASAGAAGAASKKKCGRGGRDRRPWPKGAGMNSHQANIDAAAGARSLVAAVAVALADLERSTGGLNALEQAEAERIRQACGRLLECASELTKSALVVAGS